MRESLSNDVLQAEGTAGEADAEADFGAEIRCFDAVPPFLEAELDILYQHLNSSFRHFAFRDRARGASAYIARREGRTLAIFLFHVQHGKISVLNEMVLIPPEEIERFARFAFARFPVVSTIRFSLIDTDIAALSRPFQQHGHSEDIIVKLPDSADAYLASLGSKTRHNIRHQLKALSRDRPELQFMTLENGDIRRQQVLDLLALKQRNTNRKGIAFGISPEEAEWLVQQAQDNGLLVAAMAGDRLCGGSLSLRLGEHYFAYVVAFEPEFEKYSLGMLCCYLAMREKIVRKGKAAHLSWGRQPYKFKLLGIQHDMANLDIYRSHMAYWRHTHVLARHAVIEYAQHCKRALLDSEQRQGFFPAMARVFVGAMRNVKRSAIRRRAGSENSPQ